MSAHESLARQIAVRLDPVVFSMVSPTQPFAVAAATPSADEQPGLAGWQVSVLQMERSLIEAASNLVEVFASPVLRSNAFPMAVPSLMATAVFRYVGPKAVQFAVVAGIARPSAFVGVMRQRAHPELDPDVQLVPVGLPPSPGSAWAMVAPTVLREAMVLIEAAFAVEAA